MRQWEGDCGGGEAIGLGLSGYPAFGVLNYWPGSEWLPTILCAHLHSAVMNIAEEFFPVQSSAGEDISCSYWQLPSQLLLV